MTTDPDDLGDAQSREANRVFREMSGRVKSGDPVSSYQSRWVPTGNWRVSPGDIIVSVIGVGIILVVICLGLLGFLK